MLTIGFITRKGGASKTSCCHHLGAAVRKLGYRVLLVDMDPQASLTQGLLGTPKALSLHPAETMAGLFNGSGMTLPEIVRPLGGTDFALVPAHDEMFDHNETRPHERGDRQFVLRDGLAEVSGSFDFCLVDGPPHYQLMGWNILAAADGVVIPAVLEEYGLHGVAAVLSIIDKARRLANPSLQLIGLLPTMFKKGLKIHATFEGLIRDQFGEDVFASVIPEAKDFKEAVTANLAIGEYKGNSSASRATVAVAEELIRRATGRCSSMGMTRAGEAA